MSPDATAAAAGSVTSYLVSMGLPGIVILGLALAWYFSNKRINELTDKMIELTGITATATANSTASINRLTDMLGVKRESGA